VASTQQARAIFVCEPAASAWGVNFLDQVKYVRHTSQSHFKWVSNLIMKSAHHVRVLIGALSATVPHAFLLFFSTRHAFPFWFKELALLGSTRQREKNVELVTWFGPLRPHEIATWKHNQ
jgi:hypothetical protein